MAGDSNPTLTQPWLLATLADTDARLKMAADAGSSAPDLTWVDGAGVVINVRGDEHGFTLTATPSTGQDAIGPLRLPRGWAATA
jgi:hypothetical protein